MPVKQRHRYLMQLRDRPFGLGSVKKPGGNVHPGIIDIDFPGGRENEIANQLFGSVSHLVAASTIPGLMSPKPPAMTSG
jgi:hypothetical protein